MKDEEGVTVKERPYYCPRCERMISASDVSAGVVCRSSNKMFARGPCYFDDRAWSNPPGTAAAHSREWEKRNRPSTGGDQ